MLAAPLAPGRESGTPVDEGADCAASAYARIVIIIDDMGNNRERDEAALALPGRLTYAIMPFTPFAQDLSEQALHAGREVMVHAPMSSRDGARLGRGGLTAAQSREEFRATLAAQLEALPGARGLNNHMGSDLTARRPQMAWLMQELRTRDMYFVDSRTTDLTVAATVADEFSVPNLSRQVFLDNDTERAAIEERFDELLRLARRDGLAVAIGHPYRETIDYLATALPQLEEAGVRLIPVSEALQLDDCLKR